MSKTPASKPAAIPSSPKDLHFLENANFSIRTLEGTLAGLPTRLICRLSRPCTKNFSNPVSFTARLASSSLNSPRKPHPGIPLRIPLQLKKLQAVYHAIDALAEYGKHTVHRRERTGACARPARRRTRAPRGAEANHAQGGARPTAPPDSAAV